MNSTFSLFEQYLLTFVFIDICNRDKINYRGNNINTATKVKHIIKKLGNSLA